MIKLNDNEKKVLTFLVEGNGRYHDYDDTFWSFSPICDYTGLERRIVRIACRSLKRKGLADFTIGLCSEEGDFMGAGYGVTREGKEYYESESSPDKPTQP